MCLHEECMGLLVELLFQNIFLNELNIMEKPFKTVKIPSNRWLYFFIYFFISQSPTEKEHPHPDQEQVQPRDQTSPLPPREPLLHAL